MKPTLPLISSLAIILISFAIITTLQTSKRSTLPQPVSAQSQAILIPKLVSDERGENLELYLQLPPQTLPLNGIALQADLLSEEKKPIKSQVLTVNPDLVQKQWRFPKSDTNFNDNGLVINLIATSFTPGGHDMGTEPILLATLPLDSNSDMKLVLIINPENSQVTTQGEQKLTFENAGSQINLN